MGHGTLDGEIHDARNEYGLSELNDTELPNEPIELLRSWLEKAKVNDLLEYNAMVLSTMDEHGPANRIVLLRSLSKEGLEFFTNHNSTKARNIARDPHVAALFFWPEHERQVRIQGKASTCSNERSDEYFASRPRESQLGAWASKQSAEVKDRATLEVEFKRVQQKFEGAEVHRPPHWGGYIIDPDRIEFWQGRSARLHDRILFKKINGTWERCRLQP